MVICHAYSVHTDQLAQQYDEIVEACRKQGITHVGILASITGKLLTPPEELAEWRRRLEADGIGVWAEVFGVGHPSMGAFYDAQGNPPQPDLFWEGGLVVGPGATDTDLLPRGWQYAVNEFGNPVYCTTCVNEAAIEGNKVVMRELAAVFDEIVYDDEFRLDGDQGAGTPSGSTAACYCDACLADLSERVGRIVTREDVLADQSLHDAWMDQKVEKLTAMWQAVCETGREVNPSVRMGLMIRWGGEERDGLDVDQLLPYFGEAPMLRAGEGHFTVNEYTRPENQAIEYLVTSYHVSWFPQDEPVWSETTYFEGVTQQDVLKKVALALGAGVSDIAYCPCVSDWIMHQNYLEGDQEAIARWAQEFGDASRHYSPIAILRGPAAGRGDRRPTQRVRDRQPFPLFSMAGLFSTVIRQGHWLDDGSQPLLAITGRTVWDVSAEELAGRELVLDGAALLEGAPLNDALGVRDVAQGADGRVVFTADGLREDGQLYTKEGLTIVPYVWQDVPEDALGKLMADIRRVLGAKLGSVVVEGDVRVLPVHARHEDHDAILLVNLTHEPRRVSVRPAADRPVLKELDGSLAVEQLELAGDEIRVLIAST